MRTSLLPILSCPFCHSGFQFEEKPAPAVGRGEFGLLTCDCSTFPVIDGIPIVQRAPIAAFEHTTGSLETRGVAIETLVELVRRGETMDALLECLVEPYLPRFWRRASRFLRGSTARKAVRAQNKRALLRLLLRRRDVLGAREVLDIYYMSGGPLDKEVGHYFVCRFGQPRHLAALALAATLKSQTKPILDIACGIGNLEHYLGCRADRSSIVGLDINFHQLWIAKHWMAPAADYVCGDASVGLPFADDAFAATICSDAYHYIGNREGMLREIARCAPGRPVMLTRVGNRAVLPNEGSERPLSGYLEEFASDTVQVFDEDELVRSYLRRADPFDRAPRGSESLSESKWLSFAWNVPDASGRRAGETDTVRPHAVGQIGLNPIYAQHRQSNGDISLRFQFPGIWYAYENHAMLGYHVRSATLGQAQTANLSAWQSDENLRNLVDTFVLLGLPDRFAANG